MNTETKLREALRQITDMDAQQLRADDLGRAASIARAALALPEAAPGAVKQALTDPENQPNQYGVVFGMRGRKMMFSIGRQSFTLDHEPTGPGEFEWMKACLAHAMSVFTPDGNSAPPAPAGDALDAARWRAMRELFVAVDFAWNDPPMPVAIFELAAECVSAGPEGADELADAAIDAAMSQAGAEPGAGT